jgi:hypothetical protein
VFPKSEDLWVMGRHVSVLLLNGERFLDFPRPLPIFILSLGALASKQQKLKATSLEPDIEFIYSKKESKGVVIFSMVVFFFAFIFLLIRGQYQTLQTCPGK